METFLIKSEAFLSLGSIRPSTITVSFFANCISMLELSNRFQTLNEDYCSNNLESVAALKSVPECSFILNMLIFNYLENRTVLKTERSDNVFEGEVRFVHN